MRKTLLLLLGLLLPTIGAAEANLSAAETTKARQTAIGQSLTFENLPLGSERNGSVRMKRIDVYAPGAKILLADKDGYRELPRSTWVHRHRTVEDQGPPTPDRTPTPDSRVSEISYTLSG